MSVILRLQHLPWTANAMDIRRFFHGLQIPDGGVHIVGGDNGDAFIAFSTDEDARKAMQMDNQKMNDQPVRLLLSSKSEMQSVIAIARGQMTGAVEQPPQQPKAPEVVSPPPVVSALPPGFPSNGQPPLGALSAVLPGFPPASVAQNMLAAYGGPPLPSVGAAPPALRDPGAPGGLPARDVYGREIQPAKAYGEVPSREDLLAGLRPDLGPPMRDFPHPDEGPLLRGRDGLPIHPTDRSLDQDRRELPPPHMALPHDIGFPPRPDSGREPPPRGLPPGFSPLDADKDQRGPPRELRPPEMMHDGRQQQALSPRGPPFARPPLGGMHDHLRPGGPPVSVTGRGGIPDLAPGMPAQSILGDPPDMRRLPPGVRLAEEPPSRHPPGPAPWGRGEPPSSSRDRRDLSPPPPRHPQDYPPGRVPPGDSMFGMRGPPSHDALPRPGLLPTPPNDRPPHDRSPHDLPPPHDRPPHDRSPHERPPLDRPPHDWPAHFHPGRPPLPDHPGLPSHLRDYPLSGLSEHDRSPRDDPYDHRPPPGAIHRGPPPPRPNEMAEFRNGPPPPGWRDRSPPPGYLDEQRMRDRDHRRDRDNRDREREDRRNGPPPNDRGHGGPPHRKDPDAIFGGEKPPGERDIYIYMSNMPRNISYREIRRFFSGFEIPLQDGIKLINDRHGNRIGSGYVRFARERETQDAVARDGEYMQDKRVRISRTTEQEYVDAIDSFVPGGMGRDRSRSPLRNRSPDRGRRGARQAGGRSRDHRDSRDTRDRSPRRRGDDESCIIIHGFPVKATKEDVKLFFKPLHLGRRIYVEHDEDSPVGMCYVDFPSIRDARESLRYHKRPMLEQQVEIYSIKRDGMKEILTHLRNSEKPGKVLIDLGETEHSERNNRGKDPETDDRRDRSRHGSSVERKREDGPPRREDPQRRDNAPHRDDQPPRRDDLPPRRDDLPPRRDDLPPRRDDLPPRRDDLPPRRDDLPPRREELPPRRDDLPPRREELPPRRDDLPPRRDNLPPGRDDLPPPRRDDFVRHDSDLRRDQFEDMQVDEGRMEKATTCVRIDGIPFSCTIKMIHEFFRGCKVAWQGTNIARNDEGQAIGYAFIQFDSVEDCQRALIRDKQYMGKRYIEVMPISQEDFDEDVADMKRKNPASTTPLPQLHNRPPPRGPPGGGGRPPPGGPRGPPPMGMGPRGPPPRMMGPRGPPPPGSGRFPRPPPPRIHGFKVGGKGFAPNTTEDDVMEFFAEYQPIPGSFNPLIKDNKPTGKASVSFHCKEAAEAAIEGLNESQLNGCEISLYRM